MASGVSKVTMRMKSLSVDRRLRVEKVNVIERGDRFALPAPGIDVDSEIGHAERSEVLKKCALAGLYAVARQ